MNDIRLKWGRPASHFRLFLVEIVLVCIKMI